MPQPVTYTRNYDFTSFQEQFPDQSLPAAPLDANLDAIGISVGQIVGRIALIQRDDGFLKNQVVTLDSLSNDVRALLGSTMNPRGIWVTGTNYAKLDLASVNGITYITAVNHLSGTFSTDLAAGKWVLFSNPVGDTGSSFFQKFSGNGVQTVFTLSDDLGTDEKALMVFYDAGGTKGYDILKPTAYTVSGTSLTISPAPALATDNIYVFAPGNLLGAISSAVADAAASAAASAASAIVSANASKLTKEDISTTTYTLVLADAYKMKNFTNASPVAVTIPPNSSVAFDIGVQLAFRQDNTSNQLTCTAGAGVTLNSKYSRLKSENAQYSMIYAVKVATNVWQLTGDMAP